VIVFDQPRVWNEKFGASAHLMSTLYGLDGTKELMTFAKKLRLDPRWVQNKGCPVKEHFDIMGVKIESALRHGATEISASALAALMQSKRATQQANIAINQKRVGTPIRIMDCVPTPAGG
jgi:hypothetical protein